MNNISPNINNNPTFTSKLNPIKPFKMIMKSGEELTVSELNLDKDGTRECIYEISKLFCDNISKSTDREIWTKYRTAITDKEKDVIINDYARGIWRAIHNPKTKDTATLLVVKDGNGKIQGANFSTACSCVPGCLDSTLYLHSGAVNPTYRGQGVAGAMAQVLIDANKSTFTDAYVTASDMAVEQLKKQGFKTLNPDNPAEKKIIKFFNKTRPASFNRLTDMYVELQPDKPRWTEGAVKGIKQWEHERPIRFMKNVIHKISTAING